MGITAFRELPAVAEESVFFAALRSFFAAEEEPLLTARLTSEGTAFPPGGIVRTWPPRMKSFFAILL